ncbi:hypothetical protein HN903_00230 [archaeon]|nr:hypothetical protein [archaeon]
MAEIIKMKRGICVLCFVCFIGLVSGLDAESMVGFVGEGGVTSEMLQLGGGGWGVGVLSESFGFTISGVEVFIC